MRVAGVAVASLLLLAACPGRREPSAAAPPPAPAAEPPPPARAFRVERAADLLRGPAATGAIGDWRLENGRVAFIVSDAAMAFGFSESGGNLLDAAPAAPGGEDALSQLYLYLDDTFPRQALTAEVQAGGDAEEAFLVARGVDSRDPTLAITTWYRLRRGDDTLRLVTTIENRGAATVSAYEIGDVISWGQAEHFAPGHGFQFRGRLELPWLAGMGERVSYGYTTAKGSMGGPHGSAWSDTILTTVDLAPGESVTVERYLVVGTRGDVAGVLARIYALRKEKTMTLSGRVVEAGSGAPVAGALVAVADAAGKPITVARAGDDARFAVELLPGDYTAVPAAPGRAPTAAAPVALTAAAETALELSPPSAVAFTVRAGGAASPAKLTILGAGATPTPLLGPRYRADGAGNVVVSAAGHGTIPLAPGRYRVVASRGPEFTLAAAEIELAPGATVTLELELDRVVDTTGYVSADFHQHALPSPDSTVALPDRVAANLAEGVELAVATDHNQITDYAAAAAALGGAALPLRTVVGLEATTEQIGHFQAYPLTRRDGQSRGGAPLVDGKPAGEIFRLLRALAPDVVVQVNHPRSGKSGYFELAGFPDGAALDLDFDAIEILNGKRVGDFDRVLADWFVLLARGLVVTATGGSDAHHIQGQEVGYPRTYLGVGTDDPHAVTDAQILQVIKRSRDVVVTNGPFVTVRKLGSIESAIGQSFAGAVDVEVTVQAAPWVDVDTLELWRDGRQVKTWAIPAGSAAGRFAGRIALDRPGAHVFVVRGDAPLDPVVPAGDDGRAVTPVAVTNPVWVQPKKKPK